MMMMMSRLLAGRGWAWPVTRDPRTVTFYSSVLQYFPKLFVTFDWWMTEGGKLEVNSLSILFHDYVVVVVTLMLSCSCLI